MSLEERMSPDLDEGRSSATSSCLPLSPSVHDEPRDLSIKRKMRPVPPPLDLSKRTLEPESMITEFAAFTTISPRSPHTQKNLPLRKRAHSWSYQLEAQGLQLPANASTGVIKSKAEVRDTQVIQQSSSSSSSSSLKIPGLPTPHTPHTPHPHSAIPVITNSSRFSFGENPAPPSGSSLGAGGISGGSQGPLNLTTTPIGGLPSSLLSPAPSHPSTSSLNSSREELESDMAVSECHLTASPHIPSPHLTTHIPSPHHNMPSPHHNMPSPHHHHYSGGGLCSGEKLSAGSSPLPPSMSPLHSPATFSHQWPTNVWSVFMAGVQVHFVLNGGQISGPRLSEELGQLERAHHQRYFPHGLHLMKILREPPPHPSTGPAFCHLHFQPVMVQQQDIVAITPSDHPFYVHGKGWCSVFPERATERYGFPCQQLQEGDVCLPPYHPETTQTPIPVITPEFSDGIKQFEFDESCENSMGAVAPGNYSAPPSATLAPHTHRSVFLSPPASPSKRRDGRGGGGGGMGGVAGAEGCSRPRRPMNGFMLYAKYHRLKLIQQYPGKDNRAISVLLGAMWKTLAEEEREKFNSEARVQAEERKRIDPDCWKRKRSHSTS
ncbi:uncharacterized protein LOC143038604 [Oratosquilla oratoria]|uniref:uncharacterized protein LOC143038604 n=1 Tax=Oratosquilla oratoria TaxID=337810 RepID=UPI003F75DA4A